MMEANRSVTIEAAASLDLVKDDYKPVLDMIIKKYERKNTTPTGFNVFDNNIMNGGFEPSRLYIFGGGTGAGKSTMLNNLIYKSALMPLRTPAKGKISKVYIYVTLENAIDESLMRTYMPMFNKNNIQTIEDITNIGHVGIKKMVLDRLLQNGSTIIMKYFPAMSISQIDLMGVVDDAIAEYGKEAIAGLYVDYLDLLKADIKYDMYRLELGHITLSLKTLAVQYNIPVITASALGKSAYEIKESKELTLGMISESIKKVEHADFVMLLGKDPVEENLIHGKVGKNRSGKAGVAVDFIMDFNKFQFKKSVPLSNKNKPDSTSNSIMDFSGMSI